MKKSLVIILVLALVFGAGVGLSACQLESRTARASMPRFASCDDLVEAFREGQESYGVLEEDLAMPMSTADSVSESLAGKAQEYSTTNVQVAGVDEADIVKSDGEFIYTISGRSVFIVAAYPPGDAGIVSRIDCDEDSRVLELFAQEDRLVVIGSSYLFDSEPEPLQEMVVPPQTEITYVKVYDISSKENPELLRTIEYEGGYSTSRMVDDNVYVVLTTYPDYFLYEDEDIEGSDIIPKFRDTQGVQEPAAFRSSCGCLDVEYIDPEGFSTFLSVLAFSLRDMQESIDRRVIAGYAENVYASMENLYVASSDYGYYYHWPHSNGEEKTTVYKFRLDGPRTTYLTSAEVPGTILNQFSMDEYDGYFRIATTRGQVSREEAASANNVYILDSNLIITGRLEGLAPGERIYSARFMGDKAYLVTFKKVDPFFVLDMADPGDPKVLGALKIPGYSDYLHPYDENHIIGIGKNTVEADPSEGAFAWYQGMKIAIFDVTDLANPVEMHKVEIGDRGTDSYALYDHKAFLFDRERNLLVLPVMLAELTPEQKASPDTQAFDYGEYTFQGAYVYDISLDRGIELKGRITHMDGSAEPIGDYYYGSGGEVMRSLYIEDSLYTISDALIKINRLADLEEEASVRLDQ